MVLQQRGRPRDPQVDDDILDATLALLARDGYARMSVDAVAELAGVTKPTVYRRWPSKEELVTAALQRIQAEESPVPTNGDLAARLVAALRGFQRSLLRPNGMAMIGTLLAEEHHNPRLLELFRERLVAHRRDQIRGLLEAARASGEIREDADLDAAVNLLVGSFYARYLEKGHVPRDWPKRIVAAVLSGLEAD